MDHTFLQPDIKVKIKGNAIRLSDDTIYSRLRVLGSPRFTIPDNLDARLLSATTTRKELATNFGGSPFTLLQRISADRTARHGYKQFLCPMLEMNPHAPQVPGAHGLMFRSGDDDDKYMIYPNSCSGYAVAVLEVSTPFPYSSASE